MPRRRVAWLSTLALTAAGGLLAHLVAYRVLLAGDVHAAHHHAGLRLCAAACAAVAVAGLVLARLDGRRARTIPVWVFALLPPAGFVLQEQLAWALHGGAEGPAALRLTAVVFGLVLQLPVAVAAFAIARTVLALSGVLAGGLRQRAAVRLLPPGSAGVVFHGLLDASVPRFDGLGQRAPPAPA
jgi:hypothetical protein